MSAYSNLLGLYPTSDSKIDSLLLNKSDFDRWPIELPWQPIPVHTVPLPTDYVREFACE